MNDVLLVDLGKTSCTAATGGARPGRVHSVGGAPGLAEPGGVDAAARAVREAASAIGMRWSAASVGAAGAMADPSAADRLAERVAADLRLDRVAVSSDVVMAHAGALAGHPGVVVVAGTGVAGLAVDATGAIRLVGGAGPRHGDAGGGGWIGLQALRMAEGHTRMREEARRVLGPGWPDLAARTDGAAAGARGALVPVVEDLAVSGDPEATRLLMASAEETAQAALDAVAAMPTEGVVEVCFVGGLTHLGSIWHGALQRGLARCPRAHPVRAVGGPLDGALRLARDHGLPHEAHVHRHLMGGTR